MTYKGNLITINSSLRNMLQEEMKGAKEAKGKSVSVEDYIKTLNFGVAYDEEVVINKLRLVLIKASYKGVDDEKLNIWLNQVFTELDLTLRGNSLAAYYFLSSRSLGEYLKYGSLSNFISFRQK